MTDVPDLKARREAMVNKTSANGERNERVWKLFTDTEKAAAIKAATKTITIGSGHEARQVVIRPLNPKQLVESYGLLRDILTPLIVLFEPNADRSPKNISITGVVNALGDNVHKIPDLVYAILKRGNEVSREWIDDNLDILIDLQLIIPAFLEQNALGKLLGNESASAVPTPTKSPTQSEASPQMAESLAQ